MMHTKHGNSNKTSKRLNTISSSFAKKLAIGNQGKSSKEDKKNSRNRCAKKEKEEKRKRKIEMVTNHFTLAWLQNMMTKTMMTRDSVDRSQNWCQTHLLLEEQQGAVWVRGKRVRRLRLTCVKMTKSLQDCAKFPLEKPHLWVQAQEVDLAQDLAHQAVQARARALPAVLLAIQDALVKSKEKKKRAS